MYLSSYYFNFLCFSYFDLICQVNLKMGFLFYYKKLCLYYNNTKNIIFMHSKGIKTLLRYFLRLVNLLRVGHFIELLTVGLGYNVKYYRRRGQLCFELNYSHRIFYQKPFNLLFKVFKKRFLIFGINKIDVIHIAKMLRSLRSPNIYKGTGVRYKSEKIVLKTGKVR